MLPLKISPRPTLRVDDDVKRVLAAERREYVGSARNGDSTCYLGRAGLLITCHEGCSKTDHPGRLLV